MKDIKDQILMRILFPIAFLVIFVSCTVVRHDDMISRGGTEEERFFGFAAMDLNFDPQQYAAELWEPVILPRIENMAVDFNHLITALAADENATSQRYGFRFLDVGNLFNFAVKGTARILSVNTASMNGNISVDFAPFDGQAEALISIGPAFRGTAIRDIQDAFSANDFLNQVQFARLARELNNKVRDTVVNDIDFSQYIGEEVEIIGVFTYSGGGRAIEIVPVRLSFNRE
jgi:predicted lipoprotein